MSSRRSTSNIIACWEEEEEEEETFGRVTLFEPTSSVLLRPKATMTWLGELSSWSKSARDRAENSVVASGRAGPRSMSSRGEGKVGGEYRVYCEKGTAPPPPEA